MSISISQIDFNKENNKDSSKFRADDDVRISKYRIFLQKFTSLFVRRSVCELKKLNTLFRGHTLLMMLMVKKLWEYFIKKNCKKKKTDQKKIRFENVIKRKGKKLYVKTKRLQLVFLTVGLIGKTQNE